MHAHHHHAGDPEKDDVEAGDEHRGRVITLQLRRFVRPAHGRERPQRGREPRVEHVLVTLQLDILAIVLFGELVSFLLVMRDKNVPVGAIPCRDLMPPPELARDAPGLDVLKPLEIDIPPVFGNELCLALANDLERGLRQGLRVDIPLVGQERLDNFVRAVAIGDLEDVWIDLLDQLKRFEIGHNLLARRETIHPAIGFGDVVIQLAGFREDVDEFEVMPPPDLEVIEVVRRRDFHGACALLRVGVIVCDNRDFAPDKREDHGLADIRLPPLILGVHRDGRVAEHRLGARRRDNDELLLKLAGVLDRIFEIPEMPLRLDGNDFEVRDRGLQLGIPVHQPLVFIDKPLIVEIDENLDDGARQPFVHGEAFARPIAGGAEALQLIDDRAARMLLPGPDALQKLLASKLAAAGLLLFHELPFDKTLSRDARMVRPRLPKHVAPAHALEPRQHILQRVVQRVAHVKRTRHVWRRNHNRKGLGFRIDRERAPSTEGLRLLPRF